MIDCKIKNIDINLIDSSYKNIKSIDRDSKTLLAEISKVIDLLNAGKLRVAEKKENKWVTNQWVKQAILLYMYLADSKSISSSYTNFFDKIEQRFVNFSAQDFQAASLRVVPPCHVRNGVFVGPKTVLMPSYVNIGAYVGAGCMVDTWACVGSCAQVGDNVHLSGGVGIGGVLEPIQSSPTIIEDNCFIGARSEIVEGVVVEEHSVISMGVYIGQSTKIYNRATKEITFGRVPAGSVVVPGSLPSEDGSCSVYAAIIVKQVSAETKAKVGINELLRS